MMMTPSESAEYLSTLVASDTEWSMTASACHKWATRVVARDPDIATLVHGLLNTGSSHARQAVVDRLDSACMIATSVPREPHPMPDRDKYSYPPYLNTMLMTAWTTGGLRDELVDVQLRPGLSAIMAIIHESLSMDSTSTQVTIDQGYWRGIAVLAASDVNTRTGTADQRDEVRRFITLPGGHPSPKKTIDLINDRGSYDADLISGLLSATNELPPVLRNGGL